MCEEFRKTTISSKPPRIQIFPYAAKLSLCLSLNYAPQLPGLVCGGVFEAPAAGNLQGHDVKVHQPNFYLSRRKAAFPVRSAGPWNRLPVHIAEAPTVSSIKDRLDANWCSIFPDID